MTDAECQVAINELNERQIRVLRGFAKHHIRDADTTEGDIYLLEDLGLIRRNPPQPGMRVGVGYDVSDEGKECFDWYEKNSKP
jgi:hypothetical protein